MQTAWLQRANLPHCLLFFSGWGMDPEPFRFLPARSCDVFLVHDYRQLQPLDLEPLAGYRQCHLLAWSMGVWVAAHLLGDRAGAFVSRTALAGTLNPIDAGRGLPPDSYAAMVDTFGPEVLATFYANMFDDPTQIGRFLASRPRRPMDELREEMAAFRAAVLAAAPVRDIYTKKIVTSRDRIFTGRNQLRAWGRDTATVHAWPHFPFFQFVDWQDLLSA